MKSQEGGTSHAKGYDHPKTYAMLLSLPRKMINEI